MKKVRNSLTWFSHVQSATEWTASVHTLHMSKPVMMEPVFQCYGMYTAVQTLHMPKPVM